MEEKFFVLVFTSILILGTVTFVQNAEALTYAIDTAELKTYWKFNETSGDLINLATDVGSVDSLGTAADGQNVGGVTQGATGFLGDAYSYDGSNDFTQIGSSTSQFNFMHNQTALWTTNFWYALNVSPPASADELFATKPQSGGPGIAIQVRNNNEIQVQIINSASTVAFGQSTGSSLPADTDFHMYTVTYDHSLGSNNLRMYIDNVEVGGSPFNTSGPTPTNSNAAHEAHLAISGNEARAADVRLDEFSILNRVITNTERDALFSLGNVSNDPPTTQDESAVTNVNTPIVINISGTDPDGQPILFEVGPATNGTLTELTVFGTTSGITTGSVTYTPDLDFAGFDVFPLKVTDPNGEFDIASITVNVLLVGTFCERDASEFVNQIIGTSADDSLFGTSDDDLILGLGGNDSIQGFDGDDCLIGDDGVDRISGGNGTDYILGDDGADHLKGGPGDDTIFGGEGPDRISGGADNDMLFGGNGTDHITGRDGADHLFGGNGNDFISGGLGNDPVLDGGDGNDFIYGREGDDNMIGGNGTDTCVGGAGTDTADTCELVSGV